MTTEAEVVRDLALQAAEVEQLEPGSLYHVNVPANGNQTVIDLERYGDAPRRITGIVVVADTESFLRYFDRHGNADTFIYSNVEQGQLTAAFNDDQAGKPGWRDHIVVLRLTPTAEWRHWSGSSGVLMGQQAFAEHIENGQREIVDPSAAAMLELAQCFEATSKAEFKSSRRIGNGERTLSYAETVDARAGKNGEIVIPDEFKLGIAPWRGVDRYEVTARFRYRIDNGTLKLAYHLDRPDEVLESAFGQIAEEIRQHTGASILAGVPGRSRSAL